MRAFILTIALAVSPAALAKTLYVEPNSGSDAVSYAANSEAAPWRTIGRAAWGSTDRNAPNTNEAARAGDVVRVAAGTYQTTGTGERYGVAYNPVNSGTSGSPITFEADGTVVLTYTSGAGPMIGAYGSDHIVWSGFTVDEANALTVSDTGPVVFGDATGGMVENCTIIGLGDNGRQDNYVGVRIDGATDVVVRNNRIRDFLGFGRNSSGIMTYYSGRLTFEHNEISNTGSGIYLKGNILNTDWIIVRYNLIHDAEAAAIDVHRTPTTAAAPTRIYQNVIRDCPHGIMLHAFDGGATDPSNIHIVNNTLVNNTYGLHILYAMRPSAGHWFWNNIVSGGSFAIYMEAPSASLPAEQIDLEHNVYDALSFAELSTDEYTLSAYRTAFGQDAAAPASLAVAPGFVSATDFHLVPGSPARTVGIDRLDLDRDGSATNVVPAGAYITGDEVIGPGGVSLSSPPSPPEGLSVQ
jgi:hypothetical protein